MRFIVSLNRNLLLIIAITGFLASALFGIWLGQKKISSLESIGEKTAYCEQAFSENPDNFTVYVTDAQMAKSMLTALCNNDVVKRQFGNVMMIVGSNDFDTYRNISYGIADLALVKDNLVSAFASEQVYGYRVVAQYPDYQAFFIGKTEKPLLTKEYFLGKRIGLLDYPSSRSGHIAPKSQLQKLDIDDSNATIQYYNSHQELRERLTRGDVDIIATYWDVSDSQQFSAAYRTEIYADISGSRWYLRGQERNTELICAIQTETTTVSNAHPSSYYHGIQPLGDCND